MKTSAPLFLLCFVACAAPESAFDSSDLDEVQKTTEANLEKVPQPEHDEDDEDLLKDDRTFIQAPTGGPVAPTALVALFADGMGEWSLGSEARTTAETDLEVVRYVRRCNKVTGCQPWGAEIVVLLNRLQLSADEQGKLTLTQRDLKGNLLTSGVLSGSKTPITLVAHEFGDALDTRRFLADLRGGMITLETLVHERPVSDSETEQWGWSMQFPVDVLGQPERKPVAAPPKATHTVACDQAAASWDELKAWLPQGGASADFPQSENFAWTRQCHALTGCTEWAKDEKSHLFEKLVVSGENVAVKTSHGDAFTLKNSAFKSEQADITVGASCAKGKAHHAVDGKHHNKLDLFESAVSVRGSGPGGA